MFYVMIICDHHDNHSHDTTRIEILCFGKIHSVFNDTIAFSRFYTRLYSVFQLRIVIAFPVIFLNNGQPRLPA